MQAPCFQQVQKLLEQWVQKFQVLLFLSEQLLQRELWFPVQIL